MSLICALRRSASASTTRSDSSDMPSGSSPSAGRGSCTPAVNTGVRGVAPSRLYVKSAKTFAPSASRSLPPSSVLRPHVCRPRTRELAECYAERRGTQSGNLSCEECAFERRGVACIVHNDRVQGRVEGVDGGNSDTCIRRQPRPYTAQSLGQPRLR